MAWSTRQLAELAGTTVKTVRYYHDVGLLDLPERAGNGYKQYQVPHLLRLLQIRRLSDLGLPLAQIAALGRADEEPADAIRLLDAELAATIERLQRVRAELAVILDHRAAVDVPEGFADVAAGLSETDRSMLLIYSRILDGRAMAEMRELVQRRDDGDDEFDALPADADEATIEALAVRMAPGLVRARAEFAAVRDPGAFAPRGEAFAQAAVVPAMLHLYNRAQLLTLARAEQISAEQIGTEQTGAGTEA
jgi:DNA-binding transcriptional MerR regulator